MSGGVLAGLLLQTAWAQPAGSASSIYTCVDSRGRKLTADRPIPECLDREQRELSPSGTVRRQIGPSLTEQERAAQELQQRKEEEARVRALEERRRERVLTARYPDKAAHDLERAHAIDLVNEVTAAAEKRVTDIRQQRKTLDLEMEFYSKDPAKAPMALRRKLAENDESLAQQQRFLAGQDQEKRRVHMRFDAELAQLRKLWEPQRAPPATPSPGSPNGRP